MPPLAFIRIGVDPVLVHLGPLALRWYGLGYIAGIYAGARVAMPYARRHGVTDEQIWTALASGIVVGLIGGRLFYVVQNDFGSFLRDNSVLALGLKQAHWTALIVLVGDLVLAAWLYRCGQARREPPTRGQPLDAPAPVHTAAP
jgi:Na+-driven multidrug efflux pump